MEFENEYKDSIEQIKKDALLNPIDYWKCSEYDCSVCPAIRKFDKNPQSYYDIKNYYNVKSCHEAQIFNLIDRAVKVTERDNK